MESHLRILSSRRSWRRCVTVLGATTAAADRVDVTSDVCVIETCNGNWTSEPFPADLLETQSSLECVSTVTGLTWKATGVAQTHRVDRVCHDHGTQTCGGGYSYYGGFEIQFRSVDLARSVCATSVAPSEIPCPQGSL